MNIDEGVMRSSPLILSTKHNMHLSLAISELRKHTILGMDIVMGCYSDVEPEAQRKLGGFEGLEK